MQVMELQAYGRNGLRPLDLLYGYRRAFNTGSIRLRTYKVIVDRAIKQGRIPEDARAVLEEVKVRIRDDIRETTMQSQTRLEAEFEALAMGGRSHSEFRSLFEEKVDEMEEYTCAPDVARLCRAYLSKLPHELRKDILYRDWPLTPGSSEHRQPVTWQEVASCAVRVLSTRADIRAPTDSVRSMNESGGGGGGNSPKKTRANGGGGDVSPPPLSPGGRPMKLMSCPHCKRNGHFGYECPSAFANQQGESVNLIAAFKKNGKGCTICGAADHRAVHHTLSLIHI